MGRLIPFQLGIIAPIISNYRKMRLINFMSFLSHILLWFLWIDIKVSVRMISQPN